MNSPYHTTTSKQIFSQSQPQSKQNINLTNPTLSIPAGPNINPSDKQSYQPGYSQTTNIQPGNPKPTQPIIDLQIYPEQKKPNPLADKQANLPLQPFSLSSPFIPPQFQSYLNNFMKSFYTPFIYKDYHINLGGPTGDNIHAALIYEDALPPPEIYSSYKTIRERNSLCEYVRGTFITTDEGELINWKGGANSLNSRLKLIELNPYKTNLYSSNPYFNLPKGFLVYKSCYPIIYDKSSTLVQCNKTSTGLNVRVYKITLKEFIVKYFNNPTKMGLLKTSTDLGLIIDLIKKTNSGLSDEEIFEKINSDINYKKFDIWREIDYYQFIRNKINYENICPNFVASYCYFIDINANLSFKKKWNQSE